VTAAGQRPRLPDGLRGRVLAASLRARAAGRPEPAAPQITPEEAFSRAADAFYGMLGVLQEEDWQRTALRGLDVQELVGHLTGVEEDVHRCLAADPQVARASHVESTQAAADRQAGRPPAETRAEWRCASGRTLDLVRAVGDPSAEVAVHGMRLPLDLLLVVRAFELWIHDNDIRHAAGLPPSVPDPSTLSLMTQAAARLLPHAAARTGLREPTSVHLVLTGPGGGTWDIPIGDRSPAPAPVGIVADAVGFCWLAANRTAPDRLDLHITGDPDRAAMVLAAASSLALDLGGLRGQAGIKSGPVPGRAAQRAVYPAGRPGQAGAGTAPIWMSSPSMSAWEKRSTHRPPRKCRIVIPGSAIGVPVAGTPMNSSTWRPVMVNRMAHAWPSHRTSWNSSCGVPKARKISS
jgi:uncharacterized protein (TIGR03083 family)